MPDLTRVPILGGLGSSMKAVRFHGRGDLRLDELAVPDPQPGEVRLRPLAAGICGTDAHIVQGEFPATCPVVLGHEVAGIVDAVGAGVKGLSEGDLVTVQPNTYCGACRYCRMGREHLCTELRAYGVHLNGGFAKAMVVPARVAYRLPPGMDSRIGCLAEPLACCVHGMDRLDMHSGSTALVIGAGLVGLMLTRLARLAGAGSIVVSEPQQARRGSALEFGADRVVDPRNSEREEMSSGRGFDVVIDAVGSADTFEHAIDNATRGGRVLVFGVAAIAATARIRPYDIYARELTVIGSFINPYTHERAVSLLPQMGLEKLKINAFPLEEFRHAFAAQADGSAAKVEILPQV
jgi:2-desacetyl-2-hydroxyethyl bacteriochlorophyllide A dehydrogenase